MSKRECGHFGATKTLLLCVLYVTMWVEGRRGLKKVVNGVHKMSVATIALSRTQENESGQKKASAGYDRK